MTIILVVRENNLYRIKGQPMRAMTSNIVEDNNDQVAPKFEQLRGSQHLGSSGKEQPSKSVKESWYEMTMRDAQEHEASRSMIKCKSLKMGLSEMIGIVFVSKGTTNQVDWRETKI
jgi:hypothetical protein